MQTKTELILEKLLARISAINHVQSIGISGSISSLPKKGEGDIDVFIYCDTIPSFEERQKLFDTLESHVKKPRVNVFEKGHWGVGDFVLINGVETWLMYFTINETLDDVYAILDGEYPDKLDNYYYPIGRCAMLNNLNIIIDKNYFLLELKNRLSVYPVDLANKLYHYHLRVLDDKEDLLRAVSRKDVLFYHFALDIALDHFLQALFALNQTYFPSRKRSFEYIKNFVIKPNNCNERLLQIIKLGSSEETIHKSYQLLDYLFEEFNHL